MVSAGAHASVAADAPLQPDAAAPWFLSAPDRSGEAAFMGQVFAPGGAGGGTPAAKQRLFFARRDCEQSAAAPQAVPLADALAAAAAAPHAHEWVPDAASAPAAQQLLDERQREDAFREAEVAAAAAAAAKTSLSNACEIMQSAAADAAAAAEVRQVAAAVGAGGVPIFATRATRTLMVAVSEVGGSPLRTFRPWFFSLAQLERVLSHSPNGAAQLHVRVETYERVCGRGLCDGLHAPAGGEQDADADAYYNSVAAPLFVADLGAAQLAQLARLLSSEAQEDDASCG